MDFDYIVVGSGFGGSVSAHRLTEKGYRVGVMEMGRRWTAENLPEEHGAGNTFYRTRVAVFQGPLGDPPGVTHPDPYFGGEGSNAPLASAAAVA